MKSAPLLLFIMFTFFVGCEKKSSSASNAQIDKPCMKGQFIANACNGQAIIQVTEPVMDTLKSSVYLSNDGQESTEYVFITDVPDAFKDGQPFYFNIDGEFTTYLHNQLCSWPKFTASISAPSRVPCGVEL